MHTAWRDQRQILQGLQRVTLVTGVAQDDGIAFAPLDRFPDWITANDRGNQLLELALSESVTCSDFRAHLYIDIAPTRDAFGQCRTHAGHSLGHLLDLLAQAFDLLHIRSGDLDPNRAFDAGGQHIDAIANGRYP